MKKWIWKAITVLIVIIGIILAGYFIAKANNITSIEAFMAVINNLVADAGIWGPIVYVIIMTIVDIFLSFIPGLTFSFILGSLIFRGPWVGLLLSATSVFLTSIFLFWIGNRFGERAAIKIVGKEAVNKAQSLIDKKSKMLLPMMFLFPIFPDDALCLVAGMTKMSYRYFSVIVILFRTVGIATTIFLADLLPSLNLTLVDYILIINLVLVDLYLIFKYQDQFERLFTEKRFRKAVKEFKERFENNLDNSLKLFTGIHKVELKKDTISINIYEDKKPDTIVVKISEQSSTKKLFSKKYDDDALFEELIIDLENRVKFKL